MRKVDRRKSSTRPRYTDRPRARRRLPADAARLPVAHYVLPGQEQRCADAIVGERIADFLQREGWAKPAKMQHGGRAVQRWQFRLPTICVINGQPVMQREWRRRRIRAADEVFFYSKPLGGRNGKMIAGIVAAIAIAAFAPWAGAVLFGSGTIAAAAASAAIAIGGELHIGDLPPSSKEVSR